MPKGILFWVLMVLALIFSVWSNYDSVGGKWTARPLGMSLFVWILLFILGWAVFGFVVQ
jgi:hypothetical protein